MKPLTGAMLIACNNCGARAGKLEWDPKRKAWCCPSCRITLAEYVAKIARAAAE